MSYVLIALVSCCGLLFATWLHYLAIMSLQRAHRSGGIPPWAYRFGMLVLGIGYLLDFLSNVLPLSVLLLEPPCEWLVSARVARHQRCNADWAQAHWLWRWLLRWRYAVARWACGQLLDPFDPSGCHCK